MVEPGNRLEKQDNDRNMRRLFFDSVILLLLLGFMFYQKIDIKITGEIIIPDSHCNFYPFAFHIANSAEEMRPYHLFTDATFTGSMPNIRG